MPKPLDYAVVILLIKTAVNIAAKRNFFIYYPLFVIKFVSKVNHFGFRIKCKGLE
ncbi:MAG TPA: hypothetical protein PK195_09270 [Ignavibacteriaceae bacterium]|nr:hypothetical protein [Ignavibacteriaceae bacterium]